MKEGSTRCPLSPFTPLIQPPYLNHKHTALVKPILKAAAAKLEKTFGYTLVAPPTHKFPKVGSTHVG